MHPYSPVHCVLTLCTILLSSCTTYREQVWKTKNDPAQVRTHQWALACKPYAMMSYLSYVSGEKETGDKAAEAKKTEVEFIKKYEKDLKDAGWRLLGNCDLNDKNKPGYGLYFDVWENRTVSPREVVFAFRGTQFSEINDWLSNLRWFRWASNTKDDQYAVARTNSLIMLGDIMSDREAKKAKVTTTGHSLGGGLAETVLYRSVPWVDQAVVFDPSPVSGFLDLSHGLRQQYLSLPFRDTFAGHRVVRAYAKGEILAYVRNAIQLFYRPHPLIYSVEFKTGGATGLINKHSMLELTKTICESAEPQFIKPVEPQKLEGGNTDFFNRYKSHLDMVSTPPAETSAKPVAQSSQ